MHLEEMEAELKRLDKLGEVFVHFKYRERYGWSFEQYVGYVDTGFIGHALGFE